MSVNSVPRFIGQPKHWASQVDTVNLNLSGDTGTFDDIATGAGDASQVSYFMFIAKSATVASRLRLFYETAGSTTHYLADVSLTAASAPKEGASGWSGTLTPATPFILNNGWKLKASLTSAAVVEVHAFGGDY